MKNIYILLTLFFSFQLFSQNSSVPLFEDCKSLDEIDHEECLKSNVYDYVKDNIEMPMNLPQDFSESVNVLFEVNKQGGFKTIYISSNSSNLKKEIEQVFNSIPAITPSYYNGKPDFYQTKIKLDFPLSVKTFLKVSDEILLEPKENIEYDNLKKDKVKYSSPEYSSHLNVPFSHKSYSLFDMQMNELGTNSHTASKPYSYKDVKKYFDFKKYNEDLKVKSNSWFDRKLWNEHFVQLQTKDLWFTLDPVVDIQFGKDNNTDFSYTLNNTRGFYAQAGLGQRFNFFTSIYESQGRFPKYFNDYAKEINGVDSYGVIPGRGISKPFGEYGFDYPVSEAYIAYEPADFMDLQFGYGKNFIGDGYRSLFISDVASPNTYFKMNVDFWKFRYTTTWNWLKDIRKEMQVNKAYLTKYMVTHYLSFNASKRLNLAFFESAVWANTNGEGFRMDYLNPFIFLRNVEFRDGQDAGNSLIGLSYKYKISSKINTYGQFIIDEFSSGDIFGGEKSWKNKLGFQLGAKYYKAFNVDNLILQLEYNQVRPYTYSQGGDGNLTETNYGHTNQSMAHLWSSNFRELVFIARYNYKRWFTDLKFITGVKGLDFNTVEDSFSYGGDIYKSYNNPPSEIGVEIGQGIRTSNLQTNLKVGYLVNPSTNLKAFVEVLYRDFSPEITTAAPQQSTTTWINFGVRTDLFNWYNDF